LLYCPPRLVSTDHAVKLFIETRCAALKGKPSDRARVWLSSATVSRTAALAASATSGPSETDIIPDHPFYLAFYTDVPAARSRMCPMTTAGRLRDPSDLAMTTRCPLTHSITHVRASLALLAARLRSLQQAWHCTASQSGCSRVHWTCQTPIHWRNDQPSKAQRIPLAPGGLHSRAILRSPARSTSSVSCRD